MPPLSCPHGDVSWMSQNWPSAELRRVTALSLGATSSANSTKTRKHENTKTRNLTDANLAFYRGEQLRGVVADSVLEYRRDFPDLRRRGDGIAANHDEI